MPASTPCWTRRSRRISAPLVASVLALAACSRGPLAPKAKAKAKVSTTSAATSDIRSTTLSVPTFWFGDADGSLLGIDLDTAVVTVRGRDADRADLTVSGTATNLLASPGTLTPTAVATVDGIERRATGGVHGEIPGRRQAPFELTIEDVPASVRPGDLVITLGPPHTNQVTVALDGTDARDEVAPRRDFVPTDPVTIAPGVTLAPTGSVLYPRYESGRAGQYRMVISTSVDVVPSKPSFVPQIHPSLATPDGTVQSIGDQYSVDPHSEFTERAIVVAPLVGKYVLSTLEVNTWTETSIPFEISPR